MREVTTENISVSYNNNVFQAIDAIRGKTIQEFQDFVQKEIILHTKLNEGEKVYFDKKLVFPRRLFAKKFPKNKVVNSVEKADVIVIDFKKFKEEFRYIYTRSLYPIRPNYYSYYSNGCKGEEWCTDNWKSYIGTLKDRMNSIYKYEGKKIVDVQCINIPSEQDLNPEVFDRVNQLLGSSDLEMRAMAMRMLTVFDYQKEKQKIAILMNLHYHKWTSVPSNKRKESVEIKSMLSKLRKDYPDFGHSHMKFWFNLKDDYPTDPYVESGFQTYLGNVVGPLKNKIKFVSDGESDV